MFTTLVTIATLAGSVTEQRTGIAFPDSLGMTSKLTRLGVRTKGPIKVYGVGQYSDGTFLLKMSYGVSKEKMASALADALKPRCSDAAKIDEFEACLVRGLPNGAPKGTKLAFETGGGSLGVKVNNKSVGSIKSKLLSSAFANIYCDSKAVCKMSAVGSEQQQKKGGLCGLGLCRLAAPSLPRPENGALYGAIAGYTLCKVCG